MQFSPTSCHFIPLRSKYSFQHAVVRHSTLYSSRNNK
jgi:putative component of membrane protein insertase Oxa1/YidC/SpoIIIJ protein YidD